ncbi:transcriptional regulator [Streptomyces longisporoflavus]|uniref:winged helix-turn-helix domain-containing protein n=1 Tax=Streptomyces longisporoflavus TaxID=28044 RepID=UPI00167E67D0|nr:winged helix-turn-helix domain-containing protein [Streptomyces longisporoflavus]GGV44406.1 transcriptional regulator [Streptomyces longisporoflavus]
MGWWQVNADTLAGSRFVVSPLAEATASLFSLERRTAGHPGERAWLDAHLPAYRERLAADPGLAELVRAAMGDRTRWIADFLTPTPTGEDDAPFAGELARIRETPDAVARAHLRVSCGGPLPAGLLRPGGPGRMADLLEWVWTHTVLPRWPRVRTVIEADVVARTAQLSQGGWAEALNGMRPGMRWLGESRLQINTHEYPPREISGARLLFVPVTPRQGWVSWNTADRYAVVYPCSGVLADAGRAAAVPEPLGRLLGPARAGVLMLLAAPKSTSQLVTLTGQGLGSVGRHLRVLLDAGLVRRRRTGRAVLYFRTAAGEVLVEAQGEG